MRAYRSLRVQLFSAKRTVQEANRTMQETNRLRLCIYLTLNIYNCRNTSLYKPLGNKNVQF